VHVTKKRALGVLGVAICFLAGCSRHSNDERYILVTVNSKVEYWQAAQAGLTKAAAQYGVKWDVRGPDNYDPEAEVQEFRAAMALKPAGILVSVADAKLMRPAIDDAINAGIPVITIDSDAPFSKRLYFIGTNNMNAGVKGGKRLVEKLHGKGNVVFYTMPQPNLEERLKGYKDVFAENPGIKIVEVVDIKRGRGQCLRPHPALRRRQGRGEDRCLRMSGGDGGQARGRGHQAGECDQSARDRHGHGPGDPQLDQDRRHRFHHRAEALHHGLLRSESPG
jgi:ribose transport system substrate-binding protein